MKLSYKISVASFFIVAFYLAVSDFFGLFDTSLFIPGELYDYLFILLFVYSLACVLKKGKFKRYNSKIVIWPYCILIGIALVHMGILQVHGSQAMGESFSVIRELLFLFAGWMLIQLPFEPKRIIRILVILDVISVIVYAIEMIYGGPLTGAAHPAGLYEPIAGMRVWRSWADIPTFEFFTVPYLLIAIVKKERLFKTLQKDRLALIVLFIGVVLKLARTELFSVLICMMIAYFYADRLSAAKFFSKIAKIIAIIIPLVITLYFVANGVFTRIASGIIAMLNVGNMDFDSTLAVRISTLIVRWNYLISNNALWLGIGPYTYKAKIVVDAIDLHGANRGVFSADNAYATFLVRYGIIGTVLYVMGHLKNFILMKKQRTHLSIAVGCLLIGELVCGFGGYDYMGKQALIKVGILFALYLKENTYAKEIDKKIYL